MENKVIQDRLALLRAKMQEEGIDFYMMPTADFHNSEYVNDYFKVREYFSNFTGSNGTLLVWKDGAGLWTDGRYFIQAEAELEGTGVELFRMLQEGVPTIEEFLEQNMQQGQTLGFDGRVIAAMDGKKYEKVLAKTQICIAYEKDLADSIWTDRPDFPAGKVTVLNEKIAGKSVEEKLMQTREKMAKDGANALLLTKLDDLMWLFNIRGCDVECNPVAMSYAYITEDTATLFIQQKALDTQVSEYLAAHHIDVKEYDTVVDFLKSLTAGYLEQKRREIPEFLDLSFPTIAGYKSNAAMMHYEATPENCATLEPEGMLLVDSGGQYLGGTTDVTRTIALGPVSDEMKKHYTMVAAAVMQLTHAHWLYGCTGRNLDILARQPIWDMDIDYQCGTGHGVGYILNVHEGPQNMRWRFTGGMVEAVFEDGMDITNEPGIYIQGSHGIRIENVMLAKNDVKNEYGQFMHFETLTWVPVDREAIDEKYLNDTQIKYLHEYQKTVYEKISPYLNEEEKEWLAAETGVK